MEQSGKLQYLTIHLIFFSALVVFLARKRAHPCDENDPASGQNNADSEVDSTDYHCYYHHYYLFIYLGGSIWLI